MNQHVSANPPRQVSCANEVDQFVDELFGAPDPRGPGLADVGLLVGGVCALGAVLFGWLPRGWSVVGVLAVATGLVLPARSGIGWLRAFWKTRIGGKKRSLVGIRHDGVEEFNAAHDDLFHLSERLEPFLRNRVRAIVVETHDEVASLLDGSAPSLAIEVEYIRVRTRALSELSDAIKKRDLGEVNQDERRAMVAARNEIDEIAGSSLSTAADLLHELGERYA